MTDLSLNQNARLTDSLERDLLRGAMESQPNAHPVAAMKTAGSKISRAIAAFSGFVADVNESMNRARAQSAHYSGSQW
ncbi:hypothetical protein ACILG0_07980 [Pseudomonadota bacterium AL_CKDN230030165-1A_HGKHYDSX7]